jgi:hypothetical protein
MRSRIHLLSVIINKATFSTKITFSLIIIQQNFIYSVTNFELCKRMVVCIIT